MSSLRIVSVVGNPRPASRTHRIAETLAAALGRELSTQSLLTVDLAAFGSRTGVPDDAEVAAAVQEVLAADILIAASPTYKGTYSGLVKTFLDRIGTGALNGTPALPVLLGGAPNHQLAVDVHFTPLLLELGASVPVRGLFVLESELESLPEFSAAWAARNAPRFLPPLPA